MIIVAAAFLSVLAGGQSLPNCVSIVRPVPKGALITKDDMGAAVGCPVEDGDAAIGFDVKASAPRARRELVAGDIIRAVSAGSVPAVQKGEQLFLRAHVGAISVERPVTALQPGKAGRRIFVVTAEGQVVPAYVDKGVP